MERIKSDGGEVVKNLTPFFIILALAILALTVTACATSGYNKGQFNLISIEQERTLGDQLNTEVDAELAAQGMTLNNAEVNNYLNRLGQKLVGNAPEVDFEYTFTGVKTDEVNAFAIPGGHVFVNTGLIAEAENEAELAGVMAHEIGHVVARHGSERLSTIQAASLVGNIIVGGQQQSNQMLANLAVQIVTSGGMLAYSRHDESEADQIGAKILYDAGYDPWAMVTFFKKLHDKTGDMTKFDVFLSTHPDPADRRNATRSYIKTLPPRENPISDTPEFRKVRAICQKIQYNQ
ncbi:MAG TPA: M48 family metallopeptidase [bacterium]|nr:M48 family metallopeptidase [bacterium]